MPLLRLYLRVLALLAPERRLAVLLSFASLVLAAVLFVEPLLFGRIIDAINHSSRAPLLAMGAWAGVGILGILGDVSVSLLADRMAHRRRFEAIRSFFSHALDLSLSFHGQQHTGRLLRIMQVGSDDLFQVWLGFFRRHLTTLLTLAVMLPLVLVIDWEMGLLMVVLLACFFAFNLLAIRRTHGAQQEVQEFNNAISAHAGDVLGNVQVVQSFTQTKAEVGRLRHLILRALAAQYPVLTGWAALSVFTRTASTLAVIGIIFLGASLHADHRISIGGIVFFVGLALMLIGRLEQFASFISDLFLHSPSLRDFFEVLDTPPSVADAPGASVLPRVKGAVVFEHVGFDYSYGHTTVTDLDFQIPAGTRVAVVGPTGAGKSTALSLLYRAADPDRGRITLDGVDIRSVTLESLRRNVAVVFQEAGLLHRTIEENIRVGDFSAGHEKLEAAVRAASADIFIAGKPGAYTTMVSERGRSLSGGERQRLAIARAILKDAPVIVLDEATSALDSVTSSHISQALSDLCRDRTTFIIAHRLATVRSADLVLVLDQGRLVEQGRYEDLVSQGGLFATLVHQELLSSQPVGSG